jgi:RHS repeat-associated protein
VGANSTRTAYIYLEGKQIAETVINGATQYAHTDALGSPVAHTNQAVTVLNRTKYEPYGYTTAGTKPGPTVVGVATTGSAIGFTGHVNDPETDLVYMQQRYYDPVAGRFLSIDPVTTDANTGDSFNRYDYTNNNPYKYIDPDGRAPWPIELAKAIINIAKQGAKVGGREAAKGAAKEATKDGAKAATSNAARREVMRKEGIPTSQQPVSQSTNASGREYKYEVPKEGGGTEIKSVQQQTMDRSHPGENHWEAGKVKVDERTGEIRETNHGRPKLQNDKSKVDY